MTNWGRRKDNKQAYPKNAPKGVKGAGTSTSPVSDVHFKEKSETMPSAKDVKVEGVSFFDGENFGIDYKITKDGNVLYPKGFGHAVVQLGGKKLTETQINKLAEEEGFTRNSERSYYYTGDVSEEEKIAFEFANEKQNDNTYNWSAAVDHDVNLGTWEQDGHTYLSIKEHIGGDVRGNYTEPEVYDITDIPDDYTGDVRDTVAVLLNPDLVMTFKYKGNMYDVHFDGGMHGFHSIEFVDGNEKNDDHKLFESGYDNPFSDALSTFLEKEGVSRWDYQEVFAGKRS